MPFDAIVLAGGGASRLGGHDKPGLLVGGSSLLQRVIDGTAARAFLGKRDQAPARRLIDGVTVEDLRLSGSGIRAKLHPPTESFADFLIRRDRENPAVVQASGIDNTTLPI